MFSLVLMGYMLVLLIVHYIHNIIHTIHTHMCTESSTVVQ